MSNSIGDLKNSGLQGNNFPWQLKVLKGLECICNNTEDLDKIKGILEVISAKLTVQIRRPILARASGVIESNLLPIYAISFSNVGTGPAWVCGAILNPGETVNFNADDGLNNYFPVGSFDWDTTLPGAELLIAIVKA